MTIEADIRTPLQTALSTIAANVGNQIKYTGLAIDFTIPTIKKAYESLLTKEEMLTAKDMGDYFRIDSDQRDLNYDLYFKKGKKKFLVTPPK